MPLFVAGSDQDLVPEPASQAEEELGPSQPLAAAADGPGTLWPWTDCLAGGREMRMKNTKL